MLRLLDRVFKVSIMLGMALLLLSPLAPKRWAVSAAFGVLCIGCVAFAVETAISEAQYRRRSRHPKIASHLVAGTAVAFMLLMGATCAALSIGSLIADW